MAINIKFNKPINQIIRDSGINSSTALFAAGEARRLMYGYVPMKTGALSNTAQIFAENGRGVVLYIQPYASFCYYGETRRFNRDKHEKASAYWDKAMTLTHKGELTGGVSNYIKNRNGRK